MAAVATMFAACSETDLVNETNVAENAKRAISFETFSENTTRATENNGESYTGSLSTHHDNYKVWAYRSTSNVLAFDGTEVNAANNSYAKTVYWDKEATTYNFYAAAPGDNSWSFNGNTTNKDKAYFSRTVESKGTNFRTTPGTVLLANFKNDNADMDKDLMIAAPCDVPNAQFGSTVNLSFIHILSRLNIIVKKSEEISDAVTLKSVKVYNLAKNASFNESTADASSAGNNTRWTNHANTINLTSVTEWEATTEENYVLESLVIPQNVGYEEIKVDGSTEETKPYIEIIYTINEQTYKAYYNLAAAFGATTGVSIPFNEGWQYKLTISLAPYAIEFTASNSEWSVSPSTVTIQ